MAKQNHICKTWILTVLVLLFNAYAAYAATFYSASSGSWNETSTWSDVWGNPVLTTPGAGDIVYIQNGHTVYVTADAASTNVTFNGEDASLIVNSSVTLTLSGTLTLNNLNNRSSACLIGGEGTLNCLNVVVGTGTNPGVTGTTLTHTFTSTITTLNITGSISIRSYVGTNTSRRGHGYFYLEEGTVIVGGSVITDNENNVNTVYFSLASGAQTGTLRLTGATPFNVDAVGTSVITFDGTDATVDYNRSGNQTVYYSTTTSTTTYTNLILSGSGTKSITNAGTTVTHLLSMEGTAVAGTNAPTYGAGATLQYKGSAPQTTGIEFPATFSGAGGVIVDNIDGVTLSDAKTISSLLTLKSGLLNIEAFILRLTSTIPSAVDYNTASYINLTTGSFERTLASNLSGNGNDYHFPIGQSGVFKGLNLLDVNTGTTGPVLRVTVSPTGALTGDNTTIVNPVDPQYWSVTNTNGGNFTSAKTELYEPGLTEGKTVGMSTAASGVYSSIGGFLSGNGSVISASTLNPQTYFCIGTLIYTTYYSYQTGNWDQISTWTTDPSGTLQIGSSIPGTNDKVVILTDRTVTLSADVAAAALDITINSGGVLDLSTFGFGSDLMAIQGSGLLRLASSDYPAASFDPFNDQGGGTTEYYNTVGFILPVTQAEYNNLTINTSAATATQLADMKLNGNLYIKTGTFRLNDNSTSTLNLTIDGNITVDSGASLIVGNGATNGTIGGSGGTAPFLNYYLNFHTVIIKGNLTNNGTVRFTNLNYPLYSAFPPTATGTTSGAATVYFMGESDNSITCNGPTTFYNLVIDKGTDQTYKVTVNSSSYQYFRLFGANSLTADGSISASPALRKALWIYHGTMVLKGNTIIPSLSEGTSSGADYYIPATGALQSDGVDVVVLNTADDYREVNVAYGVSAPDDATIGITKGGYSALYVFGKLLINDGYLSTRESGGIITSSVASGQIIINGGTVDAKQFLSASGSASYTQSGGLVLLRGRFQRIPQSFSSVAGLTDVADATLITSRQVNGINAAYGTFNLENTSNILNLSGGTIRIFDVCGTGGTEQKAFDVKSATANISVTGGLVEIMPTTGTLLADPANYYISTTAPLWDLEINRISGTSTVSLSTPLVVKNDMALASGALTANNNDLSVGGDFLIETGTSYTPGTNTTIFNGTADQTFTVNLASPLSLYNLSFNKTAGIKVTLSGSQDIVNVTGTLSIVAGILDDSGKTINVSGNIYNSGVHRGTGTIVLNGTAVQTIDGGGIFTNIELNNNNAAAAPVSLVANMTVKGTLTFSRDKLFNIDIYNLLLDTAATVVNSGSTRYFQTAGNAGDGGLTKVFTSLSTFVYDVGAPTITPAGAVKYTPATIGFTSEPTTYGSVTVVPVGYEHPVVSSSGQCLTYFWRVKSTGFTGIPLYSITHSFVYGSSDVAGTESNYVPALYDGTEYKWYYGQTSNIDIGTNTISDWTLPTNSTNFLDADFTAGAPGSFTSPTIFYSRQTGVWSNTSTWSLSGHTIDDLPSSAPGANDIVVIGDNDSIYLSTEPAFPTNPGTNPGVNFYRQNEAVVNCASLQIETGSVLDIQNNPGCTFASVLTHPNGNGKIRITTRSSGFDNPASFSYPSGDFTEFSTNDGISEFYTINPQAGTYYILPSNTDTYGTVILTPFMGSNIILPNISEVTINGDLICNGSDADAWLAMSWTDTYGTIVAKNVNVHGDFKVLGGSFVFIYNGNTLQQMTIDGDVYVSPGAGIDVPNAASSINNKMIIGGSIYNNTDNSTAPNGSPSIVRFIEGSNSCEVIFTGTTDAYLTNNPSVSTTPVTIFNKVTVNKGSSQSTLLTWNIGGTLTTPTDNWLTLQNGTLVYNRTGDFHISEDTDFTIASTAGLTINTASDVYIANAATNNNTLFLNGKLTILTGGGNIYVGPPNNTGNNADIEYSGSGASEIRIESGKVFVAGQIRRPLATTNGVLKYTQTGGDLYVYGNNYSATKAKFEILNDGSSFTMTGGTISVIRGGGTTYGDLYLRPSTYSVTAGTIYFTQTPSAGIAIDASQDYHLDANIPLYNITVTGKTSATAQNAALTLMVSPLTINGSLTLANAQSTFSTNSLTVTIKGDLNNNGTFVYGTGTTIFNGGTQYISGTSVTDFYHLVVSSVSSLNVNNDFVVNGNLNITSGNLLLNTYLLTLHGNLANSSAYSDDNISGGITLVGSSQQIVSGTGSFGRLIINSSYGARLNSNISLQNDLILSTGILDINKYQLTLSQNSSIGGAPFSVSKMIKSEGVSSSLGVVKFLNTAATSFVFPVGVTGKYTPATFAITSSSTVGSVRVNPVDGTHPTVSDPLNALKYYWQIESEGITGFTGTALLQYMAADVAGTESSYVAASLDLVTNIWTKALPGSATDNVDEGNHTALFSFSSTSSLTADYTAGDDAAIPYEVPTYQTISDGSWSDETIWVPVGSFPACPVGGPAGCNVIINNVVITDINHISALSTVINNELRVVSPTYGHMLGAVSGDGTLYLETGTLPAGTYTDFLSCTGNGTIEYGGSGTYTIVATQYSSLPNILFSGNGTRNLPNKDLTVCKSLVINGPLLDNSVNNRALVIQGTMERYNGSEFISGSGAYPLATVTLAGSSAQTIGGATGDFSGTSRFYNLRINNTSGVIIGDNGLVEVANELYLSSGVVTTTSLNRLVIVNTSSSAVLPDGGSASSYVSGPLTKYIVNGESFNYPVGKGAVYGHDFTVTATGGSTQPYTVEFFTPNTTATSVATPVKVTNMSEYWSVSSAVNTTARVKIAWDATSDLTPLMTTNGISDMRVAQSVSGLWTGLVSTTAGTSTAGNVSTTGSVTITTTGELFTSAAVSGTMARAAFGITGPVCGMTGIPVTFTSFDPITLDYTLTYTIDDATQPVVTVTALPYTLPTPVTGSYKLTGFTYSDGVGIGVVDAAVIDVFESPLEAQAGLDQSLCGTSTTTLDGNDATPFEGLWSIISGEGGAFANNTVHNTSFSGNLGETYTLRWTISNGGCTSYADVVIAFPVTASTPGDFTTYSSTVCQGSAGNVFTVPGVSGVTYSWSYSGTGYTINGTTNSVTIDFDAAATGGTLSVTATNSCGTSAPRSMTLTVPVATFSYSGSPYCQNATNPTPSFAAGGLAGTFTSTTGLVFADGATGEVDLAASIPGDYTITNTVNSAFCGVLTATTSFTVSGQTWTGTVDNDWNNIANWSCGFVPYNTSHIQIPDVANEPVLSTGSAGTVRNLVIDTGSSLTVTGNTLTITGSITSSGTFDASGGTISMEGTTAQDIPSALFAGNVIQGLNVNNTAGVTLLGPLGVKGVVTVTDGQLASDGNLTLISDDTGTALIDGTGNGQVTGNVTMQRYLSSAFGYKYFSSPFQGATVSEFGDDMNLAASFPSFYTYDESRTASGWVSYVTGTNLLVPMSGYSVHFGSSALPVTVDVSGVVNNGIMSVTLYNNNNTYTKGFNLIGNPYPSPIDWDAAPGWNRTNIDDAVYFFSASTTDQYGGTYSSYVNGIPSDGKASNIISSMQGFFVHVSDQALYPVTGTLEMDNQVRVNALTQPFLKSTQKLSHKASYTKPLFRITAGFSDYPSLSDPAVIYFDDTAIDGFDSDKDALKIFNTDTHVPSLFSLLSDGTQLSINGMPYPQSQELIIPLGIKTYINGTITFKVSDIENLYFAENLYLVDATSGTEQDLLVNGEYSTYLSAGDYRNRFSLKLTKDPSGIDDVTAENELFSAYSVNGLLKINVYRLMDNQGTITVTNLSGQVIMIKSIAEIGYYEYPMRVFDAIYIVSLETGNQRTSKKVLIQRR